MTSHDQRQIIYRQRDELLSDDDIAVTITAIRGVVNDLVDGFIPHECRGAMDVPAGEAARGRIRPALP